jgi:hypothetical protein
MRSPTAFPPPPRRAGIPRRPGAGGRGVSFPTELPSLISQTPRYGPLIRPRTRQTGHPRQNSRAIRVRAAGAPCS